MNMLSGAWPPFESPLQLNGCPQLSSLELFCQINKRDYSPRSISSLIWTWTIHYIIELQVHMWDLDSG